MKSLFNNLIGRFSKSWWLEISTHSPRCVYHFGPFETESEAIQSQPGYIQDLEQEGAQGIQVSVACRQAPSNITEEYLDAA
jgi:hypothetical protein